jgi:hypothetical protein
MDGSGQDRACPLRDLPTRAGEGQMIEIGHASRTGTGGVWFPLPPKELKGGAWRRFGMVKGLE